MLVRWFGRVFIRSMVVAVAICGDVVGAETGEKMMVWLLFGAVVLAAIASLAVVAMELSPFKIGKLSVVGGKRRVHVLVAMGFLIAIVVMEGAMMMQMVFDMHARPWTLDVDDAQLRMEILDILQSTSGVEDVTVIRVGGFMQFFVLDRFAGQYNPLTKSIWLRDGDALPSFIHELGHHIWYAQDDAFREAWVSKWDEEMAKETVCIENDSSEGLCDLGVRFGRFVSEYARTSAVEDFAESFASYREGWYVGEWRTALLSEVIWGAG